MTPQVQLKLKLKLQLETKENLQLQVKLKLLSWKSPSYKLLNKKENPQPVQLQIGWPILSLFGCPGWSWSSSRLLLRSYFRGEARSYIGWCYILFGWINWIFPLLLLSWIYSINCFISPRRKIPWLSLCIWLSFSLWILIKRRSYNFSLNLELRRSLSSRSNPLGSHRPRLIRPWLCRRRKNLIRPFLAFLPQGPFQKSNTQRPQVPFQKFNPQQALSSADLEEVKYSDDATGYPSEVQYSNPPASL